MEPDEEAAAQPGRYEQWSWTREGSRDLSVLPRYIRSALESDDGDTAVTLKMSQLRQLLGMDRDERGAIITDHQLGVTYRATISTEHVGVPRLASLEIEGLDLAQHPKGFRVPVQTVAEITAAELARPADTFTWDMDAKPRGERPEPEELLALVQRGEGNAKIAAKYQRPIDTVNRWLREARRDHPELAWPARRRGPAPQTPDANPAPGTQGKRARE